ncbi:phormicin-like [Lucilia sericata]|uniref:Defensin-1 n=1 Tax=Lucilia sericata TaxID=13632 RepID=A0A0M5JSS0_LUCSE|nr:phormicin-like [Lucilia sericata]ALD19902.1 defensin-1 [Lucilia sericata]
MKFLTVIAVALCLAVCFVSQSSALPAGSPEDGQFIDGLEAIAAIEPELHGRYKRATCDLLSATGFSGTACAAHCLLIGHRGGYCNTKSVCVCRD